jgi:hypothetical protein
MKNIFHPTRLMLILAGITLAVGAAIFVSSVLYRETRSAAGPLRVLPSNPRYFTDGSGKAIYLVGSNQGSELQDNAWGGTLDYNWYLNFLERHNHNFIRLWMVEHTRDECCPNQAIASPMPYRRTGPGTAHDGQPKFDLNQLDQAYFDRMRSRVIQARDRGICLSILLFQGWSQNTEYGDRWWHNPFHSANNINGINGDPNGDGEGRETHTLQNPAITAIQERYVAKVIDTVNDLDNVLYEISNESLQDSYEWQEHLVNFIKNREKGMPRQHPLGMSSFEGGLLGSMDALFASSADWITPQNDAGPYDYIGDPPAADGRKVMIIDTDHLQPFATDAGWPWRSFLRGHGFSHMDEMNGAPGDDTPQGPIRWAMGDARRYADKMNLAAMTPQGDLSSTGYALANPGSEYLVYNPDGSSVSVNLQSGTYQVEWFNPQSRETSSGGPVNGGGSRSLDAPFGGAAILYLKGLGGGTSPTPTASWSASPSPSAPPGTAWHRYSAGSSLPSGFGVPWDVFASSRPLTRYTSYRLPRSIGETLYARQYLLCESSLVSTLQKM